MTQLTTSDFAEVIFACSISELHDDDNYEHCDKQGDKATLINQTDSQEDDNIPSSSSVLSVSSLSSTFQEDRFNVKTSVGVTQDYLETTAISDPFDYNRGLTTISSSGDPVPPIFRTISDESSSSKDKSSSKLAESVSTITARPQRSHSVSFSSCSSCCLENAPYDDDGTLTNERTLLRQKRNKKSICHHDSSNSTINKTFYFNEKDHPAKAASIKLRYHKQWKEFLQTHYEKYIETRSISQKRQLLSFISRTWIHIGGVFLGVHPFTDSMERRVYYVETNTSNHDEITKKCMALLSARKKIAKKKQDQLSSPQQHPNPAVVPQSYPHSPCNNDNDDDTCDIQYYRHILDEDISCGGSGLVLVHEDNSSESLDKYLNTPGVYLVNVGNLKMNKTSKRQKKRKAQTSQEKEDSVLKNSNTTKTYKARVNYLGVSVNLGSYPNSAVAAAAVDISNVLFWGEDNKKPLYILTMNEVELSLKAIGITNIKAESERTRQKFDVKSKADFEQCIETALSSIGGKDGELASIVSSLGQVSNRGKHCNQAKTNKRKRIKSSDLLYDGEHVIYEVDDDGRFSWKKVNTQKIS